VLANMGMSLPFVVAAAFLLARQQEGSLLALMDLPQLMEKLPNLMVASLVASVTATVCVALISFIIAKQPVRPAVLAPSRLEPAALTTLGLYLFTIGYGAAATWLAVLVGKFDGSALDAFERLCLSVGPTGFVVLVVAGSVMPGFGEELAFRGFMQPRLVGRFGPGLGILFTSVLFGFLHMDVMQGLFAVGMGAMAGWVTWRAGTLWPAMAAHAANNATSFILTRAAGPTPPAPPSMQEVVTYAGALALGAAILAWQSARSPKPEPEPGL
jgi:uncharacterized protein